MKKAAFTLIEVMVVLSILAIIAILAYNFFGSTMKEAKVKQAVTKFQRDLELLTQAVDLYHSKNGTYPSNMNALLSDGVLSAEPLQPQFGWSFGGDYELVMGGYDDLDMGTATEEDVWYTNTTSEDVCKGLNEAWGLGSVVWNYTGAANSFTGKGDSKGVCTSWWDGAPPTDDYYIFYVININ